MQKFTKNNRISACKSEEVTVFLIMFKLSFWTLNIIIQRKVRGKKIHPKFKNPLFFIKIYANKIRFFLIKMEILRSKVHGIASGFDVFFCIIGVVSCREAVAYLRFSQLYGVCDYTPSVRWPDT